MAMPRRNSKGRFVKSGGSHKKRRNPSKGVRCHCGVHHKSAATKRRAHGR